MKKLLLILTGVALAIPSFSQEKVWGEVKNNSQEPLIGATVQIFGKSTGTVTQLDGGFELQDVTASDRLVFSYVGYISDTLSPVFGEKMLVQLSETDEALETVTVRGRTESVVEDAPFLNILITEAELQKAACCNLSESFETNASVDVSYADAVTGTKMLQMMGLDGRYVLTSREGIPNIRGLNSRLGLTFIPGTWIQSIDVGKGAGSVINGYESMTGQINVELFKPETMDKWYLNSYLNSFGRLEVNANRQIPISDKWSTAVLFHASQQFLEMDGNDDGFMDMPKTRQVNFLNRWTYGDERLMAQIGLNVFSSESAGGQLGYSFGEDLSISSMYGYRMDTRKAELFGKIGMIYPEKPTQSWSLRYSASYQDFKGGAGRKLYDGTEKTLYGNFIYQNILGSSFHQYKTGVSYLLDDYDETFLSNQAGSLDSAFRRSEQVPGVFFEYNFIPNDDLTLVAGARADFHNLFGTYFTPRIHARWALSHALTLRGSVGKGYRTPNALMENSMIWVSSRDIRYQAELQPEETWNSGVSVVGHWLVAERPLAIVADYFYTSFQSQLVYDQDISSDLLVIDNLQGKSFAKSFQFEVSYPLSERLQAKAAYKNYQNKMTTAGVLQQVPYQAEDRFFLNMGYATKYEKWKADMTLNWTGPQRLPDTSASPEEFQLANTSPDYFLLNGQISRGFRWGTVYLGGENLLNFKQKNPIIDPQNPFGENFDASMTWGPIAGRMLYAGFRMKLN